MLIVPHYQAAFLESTSWFPSHHFCEQPFIIASPSNLLPLDPSFRLISSSPLRSLSHDSSVCAPCHGLMALRFAVREPCHTCSQSCRLAGEVSPPRAMAGGINPRECRRLHYSTYTSCSGWRDCEGDCAGSGSRLPGGVDGDLSIVATGMRPIFLFHV